MFRARFCYGFVVVAAIACGDTNRPHRPPRRRDAARHGVLGALVRPVDRSSTRSTRRAERHHPHQRGTYPSAHASHPAPHARRDGPCGRFGITAGDGGDNDEPIAKASANMVTSLDPLRARSAVPARG